MNETGHNAWSEYKWAILLGGASILLIAISIFLLVQSIQNVKPIEFSDVCAHSDDTSYNFCSLLRRSSGLSQNEQAPDSVLISLNSASQFELELLPGVGPVTAEKIITNRPYESVDDLVTQKVMGQKLFEKVKIFIEL